MLRKALGVGILIGVIALLVTDPLSSTSAGQAFTSSILDAADELFIGRLNESQKMVVFIVSSIIFVMCVVWTVIWRGEQIHNIRDDEAFSRASRLAYHPLVFIVLIFSAIGLGVTGTALF